MFVSIIANKMINNQSVTREELETIIFEVINFIADKYQVKIRYHAVKENKGEAYTIYNANTNETEIFINENFINSLNITRPPLKGMINNFVKLLYFLCRECYYIIKKEYLKNLKIPNIYSIYNGLEEIIKIHCGEYFIQNKNSFLSTIEANLFSSIESSFILQKYNDRKGSRIERSKAKELKNFYNKGVITPYYSRNGMLKRLFERNLKHLELSSDIIPGKKTRVRDQIFLVIGELIRINKNIYNLFEAKLLFDDKGNLRTIYEVEEILNSYKLKIKGDKFLKEFNLFSKTLLRDIRYNRTLNYPIINELRLKQIKEYIKIKNK